MQNEDLRIQALHRTKILDTVEEERFDRLTRLTKQAFGTDIALISLVDSDRQWFKSNIGLDATSTPRCEAICDHAIRSMDVMVVSDARKDDRFSEFSSVKGGPGIAFYAGAPLITSDGFALGTLCILDSQPRFDFSDADKQMLKDLSVSVITEIEANLQNQIISDMSIINKELQHRMGNMYAHVSSLVTLMGRSGGDPATLIDRIRARISTLAQTQVLIARHSYKSAPLSAIVESALSPFLTSDTRSRVSVQSHDDFEVSPRGAFTLTLMLNELVTNSVKHGALKAKDGRVSFSWVTSDKLDFEWRETVNDITPPTNIREGFGTQILTKIVPMDLQGSAGKDFLPTGLLYRVSAQPARVKLLTHEN